MSDWIRVNRHNKCPVCGHDSYCTFKEDILLCMRVQSDREKILKDGSVGWIHQLSANQRVAPVQRLPKREVTINAKKLMEEFAADTDDGMLYRLAADLRVKMSALKAIGCAWADRYGAFAFPMWNGWGSVVGIRLRASDGRKWAVTGSHQGIFQTATNGQVRGWVCEGPTDTAAALSLGLYAVGRPSCSGGMGEVVQVFKKHRIREAVILADNDEPGIRGAQMLQGHLTMRSCIVVLPTKDVRDYCSKGGNRADLEELVSNMVWKQPEVS